MAVYLGGTFGRSGGITAAIAKQIKLVNLKPVKKIQVQFDPFHANAVTARDFLYHISNPKVRETNLNCIIKTNVVCDRSEPQINIDLTNKSGVKFFANDLTVLEILTLINQHISSKVPPEEVTTSVTKLEKKKQKKR